MSDTDTRPHIDFTKCGRTLAEWLGHLPHEMVIKASEEAIRLPDEPIIVGIVQVDAQLLNASRWARNERAAIRRWFVSEHPDKPGRMRVGTRTILDPETHQDVQVIFVEYQPTYRTAKGKGKD